MSNTCDLSMGGSQLYKKKSDKSYISIKTWSKKGGLQTNGYYKN